MRTSLVPGMLNMLAYNLNRGSENVRLFEAGNVFEAAGEKTVELKRICMGATGKRVRTRAWHQAARPLSFFDLKGDVENLLRPFSIASSNTTRRRRTTIIPGRSARAVMDGAIVAQFGQIHPEVAAARKLKQDVFVAEIYLDRLYQARSARGAV